MAKCSGECRYVKTWVDNLRDFETWTIRWYDRELTITKGVSGPGRTELNEHAASMNVGRWLKWCKEGCKCDGKWQPATVSQIPLKVGDGVHGAIALCSADLHRQEYIGTCKDKE